MNEKKYIIVWDVDSVLNPFTWDDDLEFDTFEEAQNELNKRISNSEDDFDNTSYYIKEVDDFFLFLKGYNLDISYIKTMNDSPLVKNQVVDFLANMPDSMCEEYIQYITNDANWEKEIIYDRDKYLDKKINSLKNLKSCND